MPDHEVSTLEVFADVGCPFTYVGLNQILAERAQRGSGLRLVVRAWPLELVNDAPFDPHHIAAEIVDLRDQVAPDLFVGFREEAFPGTSIPAFGLAHVAYEKDVVLGEEMSLALRAELFEEGRDISDPAVLAEVADRFGLKVPGPSECEAIARAEWEEGRRRGVIGSPHFFMPGGGSVFCPTLNISRRDDGGFDIEVDTVAMNEFIESIFTP